MLEKFKSLGEYKDSLEVIKILGYPILIFFVWFAFGDQALSYIEKIFKQHPSSTITNVNVEIDMKKFVQEILATVQNPQIKEEFIKASAELESKVINFQKNTSEQENYQNYIRLLSEYFGSRIDNFTNNVKENRERIFNLEKESREYHDKLNDINSSNISLKNKVSQYEEEINEVKTHWFTGDKVNKLTQQQSEIKFKIEENDNKINGYEQQLQLLEEKIRMISETVIQDTEFIKEIEDVKFKLIHTKFEDFKKIMEKK